MADLFLIERDPITDFSGLIKNMRESHGFSYRMIADAIGVPHTTVQRWGEGSPPNYEDAQAMLKLDRMIQRGTFISRRI